MSPEMRGGGDDGGGVGGGGNGNAVVAGGSGAYDERCNDGRRTDLVINMGARGACAKLIRHTRAHDGGLPG